MNSVTRRKASVRFFVWENDLARCFHYGTGGCVPAAVTRIFLSSFISFRSFEASTVFGPHECNPSGK